TALPFTAEAPDRPRPADAPASTSAGPQGRPESRHGSPRSRAIGLWARPGRLWSRVVSDRARAAWGALNRPRGWKFSRLASTGADPRLELAAAIFAAELSRW